MDGLSLNKGHQTHYKAVLVLSFDKVSAEGIQELNIIQLTE